MHLELSKDDSMFVITSAGDNALHYAIAASPRTVRRSISESQINIILMGILPYRYIVST